MKDEKKTPPLAEVSEEALRGMTEEERIDAVALRILKEYRAAFEELAK